MHKLTTESDDIMICKFPFFNELVKTYLISSMSSFAKYKSYDNKFLNVFCVDVDANVSSIVFVPLVLDGCLLIDI